MIMMDDALAELFNAGEISGDEAVSRAVDPATLKSNLGL
jgi:Tfp pilus assembly ATPase PilU